MTADRRNASVIIALILSMTVGARVLLWLEPSTPRWSGDVRLTAETGSSVQTVEITYADTLAKIDAVLDAVVETGDSLCVIDPDGEARWQPRGATVQMIVVGSEEASLGKSQQETILASLATLSHESGVDLVHVRLSPDSDARVQPGLPGQAVQLGQLLERRGIID